MTAIEIIERVVTSNVLNPALTYVPQNGATVEELSALSKVLPRPLSDAHVSLLRRWNGLNLDIIRIYGASVIPGELRGIGEVQSGLLANAPGAIVFADDPCGFIYAELSNGKIICFDTTLAEFKSIAENMDDFFGRLVFGEDSAQFAGDEWRDELKKAGLLT